MQQYSTVSCAANKACSNCTSSADRKFVYETCDEDEDGDNTVNDDGNDEGDLMMPKGENSLKCCIALHAVLQHLL